MFKTRDIILLVLFMISPFLRVEAKTFKVALLAPEGTTWSKNLKVLAKDIAKATDGEVKLKFYFGGAQGDEEDVLRKMRVGQLHGGIFTGKTLGDIDSDFRVLELPFNFKGDQKKASKALIDLTPYLEERLAKKGFINLGFTEIGSVYFVSKKQISNLEDLKGLKIWSWQGDKLVDHFVNEMGLSSVPLALPDVLSSLSTGIIEAAYAPPLAILALQWNSKITHIVDLPLTYSFGALLLNKKVFAKLDKSVQQKVKELCDQAIGKINQGNFKDNQSALKALTQSGIKNVSLSESDKKELVAVREKIIKKMVDKEITQPAFKLLEKSLKAE